MNFLRKLFPEPHVSALYDLSPKLIWLIDFELLLFADDSIIKVVVDAWHWLLHQAPNEGGPFHL